MSRQLKRSQLVTVLVALGLSGLNACGNPNEESSSGHREAGEPTAIRGNPSSERGVSVQVLVGAEANSYTPVIRWSWIPNFSGTFRLVTKNQGKEQREAFGNDVFEYIDHNAKPGSVLEYALYALDTSGTHLIDSGKIIVPRDLVIEGIVDAATVAAAGSFGSLAIEGYSRIFFKKDARLVVGNQGFSLRADDIISDNGVIETFAEGTTALLGQNGRNGGDVFVSAKRGRGNLRIYSRGENGGQGIPGAPGVKGQTGATGAHGSCWINNCKKPPEKGQPGSQGGLGANGGSGFRGGDAGRVSVRIDNPENIFVDPIPIAGRGGDGGEPGAGGLGGDGGAPGEPNGEYFNSCNCPAASRGLQGPTGPAGQVGNKGTPGSVVPACLRLGSATIGCVN